MANLLTAESENGAEVGASHDGPCTIICHEDSVFDGAYVTIEISDVDNAAKYTAIDRYERTQSEPLKFTNPGVLSVNARGTYFLRAVVHHAGPNTNINIITIQ